MGRKSKRNRQQQGFVPPHFQDHRSFEKEGEENESSSIFPILISALLATLNIVYEHVYPTNAFRKRKNQSAQPNFFTDQSSPENTMDTSYTELGLTRGECTLEEVKKAYRKLALKYHPDRQARMTDDEKKHAEVMMKNINK
jgi:hypothetical protein